MSGCQVFRPHRCLLALVNCFLAILCFSWLSHVVSRRRGRVSSRYIFNSVLTFKVLWTTFYIFVSVYQKKTEWNSDLLYESIWYQILCIFGETNSGTLALHIYWCISYWNVMRSLRTEKAFFCLAIKSLVFFLIRVWPRFKIFASQRSSFVG